MNYNKSLTATVYIVNKNRVLLHKHKKYNTWFPVGGHLEKDELPHEAAIREAKEESGLDIEIFEENPVSFSIGLVKKVPSPLAVYHEGTPGIEDFLDFIYAAVPRDTVIHPGDGESREFRWFTLPELLDENENIKIHIRNTAIHSLYYINRQKERKYFPETENAIL
ncbi:MAG: NUDIX domain-containing protein [Ruminococcaceae bacterium]|nr:NUDIX domain-containing protein [Oscillospiraceae bacterium]MBR3595909.1 NUDIX domain-containing protein [Clostridia bacterium]